MIYFVDGYNLLFKLFSDEKPIENQRAFLINFLDEKAFSLNINIHLVFDGYKQNDKLYNYAYMKSLKVIYTAKDQTADDYILEQIFLSKQPKQITVVSSDNALKNKSKFMHAHCKSIEGFLDFLSKKERNVKSSNNYGDLDNFNDCDNSDILETDNNIKRLLKIFEDKLKNEDLDWR